jgi:hypothetical protein
VNRLAFCVTALAPVVATADSEQGGGFFVALEGSTVLTGRDSAPVRDLTLVTARVGLSWGAARVRYYVSLDLGVGATVSDAGALFDAQLLPIGIGFQLGTHEHSVFVAFATGVGASGAPPALVTDGGFPFQLVAIVRPSDELNLIARARAIKLEGKTSRAGGAPTTSFGDEIDATLALQLPWGRDLAGYYFGVAYRELDRARFGGLVFGWGGGEEFF